jgi:hypothetical protein
MLNRLGAATYRRMSIRARSTQTRNGPKVDEPGHLAIPHIDGLI